MSAQGDYELRLERERDAAFDAAGEEYEITLKLGDADAAVFYTLTSDLYAHIHSVSVAGCDVDLDCFSTWQLEDWAASIRRHERALADEAWADAMADKEAA